ncbi:MAG: 3-oxoacyl-[acyl-carrier-protein] reductase [Alphaproteobacteria bacterium]|jgi:3-oxoacyl-[acyl-carrier protein] reductase|tara:strand:+ start:27342 stop:28079 length:738 start_codon:yes stop_codon:yes gene_type:complete
MFDLKDKKILLTGATGSIGTSIAKKLSEAGAVVALTGTRTDKLNEISKDFNSDCVVLPCNLTDSTECERLVSEAHKYMGSIDVLINNAGIKKDNLILRMKDDEWEDVINLNLNTVFRISRAVSRIMVKQRYGRIISIASVVGFTGNAGQVNYVASKAGVVGLTKSLALELATRGVTVNCVAPGMIDSDMIDSLNEKQKEDILKRIPMSKLGKTDDIASACLFLASDEASYVTGQTIHVNGGLSMV